MRDIFIYVATIAALLVGCSYAHPYSTFGMTITEADGTRYLGNFTTGVNYTLYFDFVDNLHNYNKVQLGSLMKYHKRYFHLLIVSQDQELALHIHPDDYTDLDNAPANTTVFFVKFQFPRGGVYSIAASFLFMDSISNIMREGFSQTAIEVSGPGLNLHPTYNLNTTNRFRSYPIGSNEVFDDWIDVKTNQESDGYWAEYEILGSTAFNTTSGPNSTLNYYSGKNCTFMSVRVYTNDSTMSTPATMVPFLAASAHFTISSSDGGVYHAHGMYLPDDMNFQQLEDSQKGMTMSHLMSLSMSNPLYNLSMNCMMIGISGEGINCLTDAGTVMDSMMGMMDMSEFYGPPTFNAVVGIFGFPETGDWRVFAYMKLLINGQERLIVPHFAVHATVDTANEGLSTSFSTTSEVSASMKVESSIAFIMISVAIALLSLIV